MELGLSLGDAPSKTFDGLTVKATDHFTTTSTTTAAAVAAGGSSSLRFCMSLGMNPSNGTTHQNTEKEADDDGNDDDADDDHDYVDEASEDQGTFKENGRITEIIDKRSKVSSQNPPVQLDLLPLAPVLRHTPLPWSSDNGSSEGGSSGNAPVGRGFDVNRVPAAAVTEEATSSFRLDFGRYSRRGNVIGGSNNNSSSHIEMGNDTVEVERASSRASDEDENGLSRKKLRLSKEQSAYLEESFKEHPTLNPKQKLALAKQLNLRPRQVEVWFQNRRARTKLKQTEVDCEYLKRCCETLTEENRRLHKELQELRALKTSSNPFYMQLPATTLTMCPSCERVATTTAAPPPPSTTNTKPVEPGSSKSNTPFPPRSFYPFPQAPSSNNSHH